MWLLHSVTTSDQCEETGSNTEKGVFWRNWSHSLISDTPFRRPIQNVHKYFKTECKIKVLTMVYEGIVCSLDVVGVEVSWPPWLSSSCFRGWCATAKTQLDMDPYTARSRAHAAISTPDAAHPFT